MVAIHLVENKSDFSIRWKQYCDENKVRYKIVSCYDSDILDQLKECKALLWHVNHYNYRDQIFAKYLIKSLENTNIKVFPNYATAWHFDDKVAQKYLLESIGAPLAKSFVFYDKATAFKWIETVKLPKVFKLRKGSGSKNVLLIKKKSYAKKLIRRAFGKGFPIWDMKAVLKERYRMYKIGKESMLGVLKGVIRLFIATPHVRMSPNENGYVYFQEFLPNNKFDQRIIIIGDKAIGLKRLVRENDFRASGSGHFSYEEDLFDIDCVKIAFTISQKLQFQSMAYDFVYDLDGKPAIVEVSYGFNPVAYLDCPGYWDKDLQWHNEKVDPAGWMLKDILNTI